MPKPYKENVNGHEFWMLPVEGGTFLMGSPDNDSEAYAWEKPQHPVRLSTFLLGQFPVTQALWRAVALHPNSKDFDLPENPSFFTGDQHPVESVSWDDIDQKFLPALRDLTGLAYRLPTEAEWEYAACGGNFSKMTKYSGSNKLKEVGWYTDNSHGETKPVGLKDPNELGLYDMSGNVWEWCADDWHGDYKGAPDDGSAWIDRPERGADRVLRGGSWGNGARSCRAAYRYYHSPGYRGDGLGFRLALSLQSAGQSLPAYL